ncbi:MAG: MFS transporter, partial [Gammaproteobacteria bacterium]|nr:MFS transporter [Gammaproteobacteria bacterium]
MNNGEQQTHDEPGWPSEAYGWYVVFVLCVCGMVAFIDRQIINLLVEDIKADLSLSDTQISLLQGLAFALFYAIAAIPLGRLADSGSRKRIIAVGIAVWTVAAASCGLAKNFLQLFLARMAVGVGEATLTPSGFSMLGDLFRPHRLSVDSATTSPPLGEVLVFVRTNAGVFAAVFLGISVLAAVQFCLGAWVPAHFIRNLGWSASQVGYAYGLIFLICGTGGVITGGFIADRLQARGMRDGHLRVAFAAALLTIPFVVSLPMVSTPEMAVMLLAPSIFLGTIPFGAGPALIPVICPARMRGLLVAIYL